MALSDNTLHQFQRPDLATPVSPVNVAAATTIYAGAFVAIDGSGDAIPAPATGASPYIGIAKNKVENPGAITTNKPLELLAAKILIHAVTGATADLIGDPVYYTDDDALSMTIVPSTGVARSQVGTLHGFDADGTPLVRLVDL